MAINPVNLIDVHTHFQEIGDKERIFSFFRDASFSQIHRVLNATVSPREWPMIAEMAAVLPQVVPFYGIHPWKVLEAPTDWRNKIAELLKANPLAGVGEMGLDKVYKDVDMESQKRCFAGQLDLAREFNRPFVVHCVRSWDWTVKLIENAKTKAPFILHFFNGPKEIMEKLLRLNGYISFNARQMDRSDDRVKEMIKMTPLERLLLETDFPYLGAGLEPATPTQYVERLKSFYLGVSRIKEIPLEQLSEQILHNGTVFTDRTSVGA